MLTNYRSAGLVPYCVWLPSEENPLKTHLSDWTALLGFVERKKALFPLLFRVTSDTPNAPSFVFITLGPVGPCFYWRAFLRESCWFIKLNSEKTNFQLPGWFWESHGWLTYFLLKNKSLYKNFNWEFNSKNAVNVKWYTYRPMVYLYLYPVFAIRYTYKGVHRWPSFSYPCVVWSGMYNYMSILHFQGGRIEWNLFSRDGKYFRWFFMEMGFDDDKTTVL